MSVTGSVLPVMVELVAEIKALAASRTSSLNINTTVAQDAAGPDGRGPWTISE